MRGARPALAVLALSLCACTSDGNNGPTAREGSTAATNGEPPAAASVHGDSVSETDATAAVQVALQDARVHMAEGYKVISVGRVGPESFGAVYLRVVLRGNVVQGPPDVCAIGGHTDNVTGLVFLVSDPPAMVEALSPEWDGSVSCLGTTNQ